MASQSELDLVVRMRNEASKQLAVVENSVKKLGSATAEQAKIIQRHMAENSKAYEDLKNDVEQTSKAADKAKSSFSGLTSSLIKSGLAITGITLGLQSVNQYLNDSVKETIAYQNALNGTISLVRSFGLSEDELNKSLKEVTSDGLLTQSDAMRAYQQLLASGLGVSDATKLINAYKDVAAFGRDSTISFADAVSGLSESFLTEMSILGNQRGLQENYNQIIEIGAEQLGKKVSQLNASERAQAKLIGTLQIAQRAQGNATKMAEEDTGALMQQQVAARNLQQQVGAALLPSLGQLARAFTTSTSSGALMSGVIRGIGVIAVSVAGAIRVLTTSLGQMGAVAKQWLQDIVGSFQQGRLAFENTANLMAKNGVEMKGIVESVGKDIKKIWSGEIPDAVGNMVKANLDYMNKMADDAKKVLEDIQKENERFARETLNMQKQFEESLKDMVIEHRDKVTEIKQDIDDENAKFTEDLADRKKKYEKAMSDLTKSHQQKVAKIGDQIKDEEEKNAETVKKISEDYEIMLRDIKKNGDNRIAYLQSQLDKENDRQSSANKDKIEMLQRMIAEEKVAVKQSSSDVSKMRQDEIDKETKASTEKIRDLKSDLQEENDAFIDASNERQAEYKDETAAQQKEHDKRLAAFKKELDAEMAIQRVHADDFARFQNAVAEDDIARLKRKNAEERAEAERAHQEKLQDIQRRVNEERATAAAGSVRTSSPNTSSAVSSASSNQTATTKAVTSFQSSLSSLSTQTPVSASSATVNKSAGGSSLLSTIANGVSSAISSVISGVRNLFGFKEGGSFTVGGTGGADSQLVAFRASPGEQVTISTPEQQRGGVTINMPTTVISSEVDMDRLVERISWRLNKAGVGR